MATIYRVDAADTITFVNDNWSRFAEANAAPELAGSGVIGRVLWDYIAGPETAIIYRDFVARARRGETPLFPFRCDSPRLARRMEMCIRGVGRGAVEFEARLLDETPTPFNPLLDAAAPARSGLLRLCSWCKRVHVGGSWMEPDQAVRELALFDRPQIPALTHGICADCEQALLDTSSV